MSLLNTAFAAGTATTAAGPAQSGTGTILFLVLFFCIFYFLVIRPQSKKAKEHRVLLNKLSQGDEVIMNSGVLGTIVKIDEQYLNLQVADGVILTIQRGAIQSTLPKGTLASLGSKSSKTTKE